MSNPTTTGGRFGPLMKKLKEAPTEEAGAVDQTTASGVQVEELKPVAGRKRALGKKQNPEYTQTTSYIKKVIYNETMKRLIDEGRTRDYSDLLNDLLSQWLATEK